MSNNFDRMSIKTQYRFDRLPLKDKILSIAKKSCDSIALLKYSGIDPSYNNNELLMRACENGNVKFVEYLLKDDRVDPADQDSFCFAVACSTDAHIDVVKKLLEDGRADPSGSNNAALCACAFAHSDLSFDIEDSQKYGEIAKLLINNGVDPSYGDNLALKCYYYGYGMSDLPAKLDHFADILLADKRVNPMMHSGKHFFEHFEENTYVFEKFNEQNEKFNEQIKKYST
ncbi:ankyrin repeat domain-containing protein [bacterium]|nr:ankyrin repeat domain-containing protein [bacterium]